MMNSFVARYLALAAVLVWVSDAYAITVEKVTSPGGITAYLAQDHTNPIIGVSFMFKGGSALDPDAKLGLSDMAAGLLDEGAGDLDSFAFHSMLEDRAISLGFAADRDAVTGSVSTTTQASDMAFKLLGLALTSPRFDAEPVERIRRQMLVKIKQNAENPGRIASRALMAALYSSHPYGRDDDGSDETVKSITADDLKAWVKARFAKDRLLVSVVGDITPKQLGQMLDRVFGALPAATGLNAAIPEAKASAKPQEIAVEKNLPQSMIYIGQPGIKRDDPDWYVAQVLDYTFGSGVFASRLMQEVREKRGLAYSAFSSLQPFAAGGMVMGGAGTRSEQAAESLKVMREEWRKIHDHGITEQELNDAKQYLTGAWPLRFSSTGAIAELLLAVQRDNLGLDYLDKRNSYIDVITLADAQRVAARLYQPDELTVVVVGPAKGAASGMPAPKTRPERERKSKS